MIFVWYDLKVCSVDRASDLESRGHWFNPQSRRYKQTKSHYVLVMLASGECNDCLQNRRLSKHSRKSQSVDQYNVEMGK